MRYSQHLNSHLLFLIRRLTTTSCNPQMPLTGVVSLARYQVQPWMSNQMQDWQRRRHFHSRVSAAAPVIVLMKMFFLQILHMKVYFFLFYHTVAIRYRVKKTSTKNAKRERKCIGCCTDLDSRNICNFGFGKMNFVRLLNQQKCHNWTS